MVSEEWSALGRLIQHLLVGLLAFCAIAGTAFAIDFLVRLLESTETEAVVLHGLECIHYFLFVGDSILLFVFLGRIAVQFVYETD